MFLKLSSLGQEFNLSGFVLDKKTEEPVKFATLTLKEQALWAITDTKGAFIIKQIPKGKIHLTISCLGYVKQTLEIDLTKDLEGVKINLLRDNLALEGVVVTANKVKTDISSSYTIDKNTLNHLQMINVADITSLLPGGKTSRKLKLTSPTYVALRSESAAEGGTPSFGTAIEVDGVRLSNNHSFADKINDYEGYSISTRVKGTDIRNISTSNIESVEIITGIPSAEEGDLESGIIKIKTRKGKSPFMVEMFTNINSKQLSLNKGLQLGQKGGVLNTGFEHVKSVGETMSPYTSYQRNVLTLNYSQSIKNNTGKPVLFSTGITGNVGGYNSESDPDAFINTFEEKKDNTLRGFLSLKHLANKSWITNLNLFISAAYADKLQTQQKNKSASGSMAALHSKEQGYFIGEKYDDNPNAAIIMIEPGYWYQKYYVDSKTLDLKAKLKADWVHKFKQIQSRFKLGADFTTSGNMGEGRYYSDLRYAPGWRSYPYKDVPYMNNLALFGEEKITFLFKNKQKFQFSAGLRSDNTWVKESVYGTVNSWSPRLNAKYTRNFNEKTIQKLNIHAGWGQAVKLPSFYVLYPRTTYFDQITFAPGTMSDGTVYYAYHTMPGKPIYNRDLEWQKSSLAELGFDLKIQNIFFSLSAYYRKTHNPYSRKKIHTPFSYKLTTQESLEDCPIPLQDRKYTVDRNTGIVTVNDVRGNHASRELEYKVLNDFITNYAHINSSPIYRYGIEWVLDFGKIKAINTSFRIDGNYYRYKAVNELLQASVPARMMADGSPYKYVAFYKGGTGHANGQLNKQLRSNFTAITHIPKIRLIVSLRVEVSFYKHEKRLSEYKGEQRSFVINSENDFFPSQNKDDIYAGDQLVAFYPEYYISLDDMETKIPFAEKFAWAKENDLELYNDLAKMVKKTYYLNFFNENNTSAFLSANINITKEIGEYASISFNAKNFFNNMGTVEYSRYDTKKSLYENRHIPDFYYGLTLRLKL